MDEKTLEGDGRGFHDPLRSTTRQAMTYLLLGSASLVAGVVAGILRGTWYADREGGVDIGNVFWTTTRVVVTLLQVGVFVCAAVFLVLGVRVLLRGRAAPGTDAADDERDDLVRWVGRHGDAGAWVEVDDLPRSTDERQVARRPTGEAPPGD